MKKQIHKLSYIFLAIILLFAFGMKAQIVGPNAYIKATSVEIGIDGAGGFEGCSTAVSTPLPGMHFRSGNPIFGFVANPQVNLWATFDGDFFTPGTPENGWGIEITGGVSASNNCANASFGSSPEIGIPGSITDWSHIFDCYSADWEGDLTAGTNLHFKVNYFVQENDLFYTTTVSITNNTASTIPEMFYYRNLDPDNNVSISSDYTTQNTIVSQPGVGCNLAHVKATSTLPASQPQSYVGLAAIGAEYRVCYGGFSNRDGSDLWSGVFPFTPTVGATNFADEGISLAYRIQNLAPGATEIIRFVVILQDASATQAINNLLFLTYPGSTAIAPQTCTPFIDTIPTCGTSVPISVTGTTVGDYTWSWSPSTGLSSTSGPSVIASPTGTTTYVVNGTPISACVAPVSFTFVVEVTDSLGSLPVISTLPTMCTSDPPILLTVDSTGGTWTGTGITNGSTGLFDPSVSGPGTFNIFYAINLSCGDTASQNFTVAAGPTPSFTSDAPAVCDGLCINFSESVSTSCVSVLYDFGDGSVDSALSPSHCYDSVGVFNVSLSCTSANGCVGTITNPAMITIHPIPTASFSISPGSPIAPNTSVTFADQTSGGVYSFWEFGDPASGASDTSTLSTSTHTFVEEQEYCITLVATNAGGCVDTAKQCIVIVGEATISVPNVFSPNGDGSNDLFFVSSNNVRSITYDIYDRWGLLIATYEGITGGWNGKTKNGKMAPDGVYYYLLKATTDKGEIKELEGFIHLFSEK